MTYLFATERPDYTDLASGRVFYSMAGHPAFPVRLGSEILQRCLALREKGGGQGRCVLYDPCCGAGYLASVLGYLHRAEIQCLIASDVDAQASALAERNLGLLDAPGLERRAAEITEMIRLYGKQSHREALESCRVMQKRVESLAQGQALTTRVFQANALDAAALMAQLAGTQADIVLTDVPYGLHSEWQALRSGDDAGRALLEALAGVLAPGGLVAIAADKQQKIAHERYQRIERFQVGKRRIGIFRLVS